MYTIYMQFDRINLLLVYISGYIWSTPFSTSSACNEQGRAFSPMI